MHSLADEVALLCHERWEVKVACDAVRTHTLEREETLRPRVPERVWQELWGLLVAYNRVRRQIECFAEVQRVYPLR
ncbi:MAG TPA: hypothetical protein VMK12_02395 [Anaeromyxobacteraceae bacterium]|nr:hypothetical protein [Anaeromyxobacteraceae bacterium]